MSFEPVRKNAIAFFDARNLYRHAKDAFGHHHPNFDPLKLHTSVSEAMHMRPTMVRFYTGIPSVERSPMWSGYWNRRILGLKRQGIHVTTRPLRYRSAPEAPDLFIPQEKGIDIRLALDLVSLARKAQFDAAIIFSQDQDLAEVVQEIREIASEQGRKIDLVSAFPAGPRASSTRGINGTQWFKMDEAFYNSCLDPRDYRANS